MVLARSGRPDRGRSLGFFTDLFVHTDFLAAISPMVARLLTVPAMFHPGPEGPSGAASLVLRAATHPAGRPPCGVLLMAGAPFEDCSATSLEAPMSVSVRWILLKPTPTMSQLIVVARASARV